MLTYIAQYQKTETLVKLCGQKNQVPTHLIHGVLDPVVIKEFLHQVQSAFTEKIDITYLKAGILFVMNSRTR